MGMSTGHRDAEDTGELSEINVTPFIDVMLVLLIIFMVAAPLATVNVKVDLPAAAARPERAPEKPVTLTIGKDLALSLGDEPIERTALIEAIAERTDGNRDERIFLRADRSVDYGAFMEVMNLLRGAGYLKIALVGVETPSPAGKGAP